MKNTRLGKEVGQFVSCWDWERMYLIKLQACCLVSIIDHLPLVLASNTLHSAHASSGTWILWPVWDPSGAGPCFPPLLMPLKQSSSFVAMGSEKPYPVVFCCNRGNSCPSSSLSTCFQRSLYYGSTLSVYIVYTIYTGYIMCTYSFIAFQIWYLLLDIIQSRA